LISKQESAIISTLPESVVLLSVVFAYHHRQSPRDLANGMSQGIDYLIEQSNFGGESPFPVPDHPWSATLPENRLTAVLMMMMPWQEGKATTR
jgi:hypothetical protein